MNSSFPSLTGPAGTLDLLPEEDIFYPESDGKPMGDNDRQREWIVLIIENLIALYSARTDVYVTGDLFWYPVKGRNDIVQAPDAMVVFGRPPGQRRSYRQWTEDHLPPQVVFEIWSLSNTQSDRLEKWEFYDRYGVQEYYAYDPYTFEFAVHLRSGRQLQPFSFPEDRFTSPLLGIHFHRESDGLQVFRPDGKPFVTLATSQKAVEEAERRAASESRRAAAESRRAAVESRRAAAEKERADRLWEKLRALGVKEEELS